MYHFIYPTKDTYIYELNDNSDKNFGGDDTLVLKKDFDGLTGLNAVSRVLLEFDLNELSQSLVSEEITGSLDGNGVPPKYYLRLYEQKTSELSNTYSLAAYAMSQSWEEGEGTFLEVPNKRNGVSWEKRNENFQHLSWSFIGDTTGSNTDTGSRSVPGGGVWITGSGYQASQSFSYESPDINMDVTDIVNSWLGGNTNIPNNGLIIKWSGSQEDSGDYSGNINFFSSNAGSIYSPKLEVRWDEHTNDYDGTIEEYNEEFNEGTGTFSYPDVPIEPITIDGTDDNYMFMMNLKKTYKETEKPRFRVAARERYQPKSVSTTKSSLTNKLVPHGSGSYSIVDVTTGETLIPFGDYSLLSTDLTSNYFRLKLDGFINNRLYKILLRLKLNDGRYRIFDNDYKFKIEN